MPISVRYLNDPNQTCVIRPAPLVSINDTTERNKFGQLSKTYRITLSGYILTDLGFPLARDTRTNTLFEYFDGNGGYTPATADAGPYLSFDTTQSHFFDTATGADHRPARQHVPYESALDAIMFKQKALRALFQTDGQRLEIMPIHTDEPAVICYPRFVGISFEEGIYTDLCKYTVELEADTLLDNNLNVDIDGNPISFLEEMTESGILAASGRFIDSYSDEWSLEMDDTLSESKDLVKSYRITRNISATGKDHYTPTDLLPGGDINPNKLEAWKHARDFVQAKLERNVTAASGYPNMMGFIGSGLLNLVEAYRGYNHTRTENISINDGSYSVSENWLLASGIAYENYNMSIQSSIDGAFVGVSITGTIKGLTSMSPSGLIYGGRDESAELKPYQNALTKYYDISSSGRFTIGSDVYKRSNAVIAAELNSQPKSITVGLNEFDGEITYAVDYDNRPMNILSGVLSENIQITDTYPGDLFATIPIIGRKTGPILQALGGRTEYRRDLNLSFNLDYTDIPYGTDRTSLMLKKPSLVEPIRTQMMTLIRELSPQYEPGIRKYFIAPPSETWEPKSGAYSISLSWTYELDK